MPTLAETSLKDLSQHCWHGGDRLEEARTLIRQALSRYPGSQQFKDTALQLGCEPELARR